MSNTANSIRLARKKLGITQAELANDLGVASNTVARWERGELTPRPIVLVALKGLLTKKPAKAKAK
jgi:transcriptional regulator with XRE-family HTH domain